MLILHNERQFVGVQDVHYCIQMAPRQEGNSCMMTDNDKQGVMCNTAMKIGSDLYKGGDWN